ncbi:alpha/beta hydrolase family protein [Roseateles sp. BYS78W]|uniref:Alpha/beta hydrolase family protein n=1 Tax=Pelomonas candidula TaxID=3299025 RepID=A0ABW7H609_9BURK
MNIHRRSVLGASLCATVTGLPLAAAAEAAPVPPLVDFFRAEALRVAVLSPDGRAVAGLREVRERWNVVIFDLASRKATVVTNFSDGDVSGLRWINNERLLFSITDRKRGNYDQIPGGLFAINKDASQFLTLAERSMTTDLGGQKLLPAGTTFHSRVVENGKLTSDVLVSVGSRQGKGRASTHLYRLNTLTARSSLLTLGGPANVQTWVVDPAGVPRAARAEVDDEAQLWVRDSASSDWRLLSKSSAEHFESIIEPLAFDASGRFYVSARASGQDIAAIYGCDLKTGQLDAEPVAAIQGFDLDDGLLFDAGRKRLLGVNYEAVMPGTYWIDDKRAAIQAQLDKQLPDTLNALQFGGDADIETVLVHASSDRDPGRFYVYDVKAAQLLGIGQSRPWIKPEQMSATRFLRYKARDGLEIPAQLTLPRRGAGKPPLVVLHYGGPWVRAIHWHWDPIVQFLASRGYAVFMPAPRASTGFGAKLYRAGWKQWGLAMQDDVTDGVRHLIDEGLVDGKRVCLAGASYGGYLTMMGLAKEPELFRCGINWVGVTDPSFMFTVTWTDFNRFGGSDVNLRRLIGDPERDAEQFKHTSPVVRAAEIKQPVLMGYGGLDQRVPLINGEKMRDALRSHNPNVEWVVYPDEGHGWQIEKNNLDFWGRVERFLAANLS